MKAFRVKLLIEKVILAVRAYESEEVYLEDNPESPVGLVDLEPIGYSEVCVGDILPPLDEEEE